MVSSAISAASFMGAVKVAIGVDIVEREKRIDAECRLYAGLLNNFWRWTSILIPLLSAFGYQLFIANLIVNQATV